MPEITTALLTALATAQLKHAHAMTDDDSIDHAFHSDDGYDYVRGALNLASALLTLKFDDDIDGLRAMLDPDNRGEFIPFNYGSDGICNAVYEALPEDWEDHN